MRALPSSGASRRKAVFLLALATAVLGCATRDDDYLLVRREPARPEGAPTRFRLVSGKDPSASRARRLLADGFGAELLRTLAMTKRFVRRTADVPAAHEATYVAFGPSDVHREELVAAAPYRPRLVGSGWFRHELAPGAAVVWVETEPAPTPTDDGATEGERDGTTLAALTRGLGGATLDLIDPRPTPLRDGYLEFLEVVAAEWRAPGMSEEAQHLLRARPLFAAVRANATKDPLGQPARLVREPTLVAALLYRMAASELGRKIGPDEFYRPFLEEGPPRGVRAARLLGAFRNFQAKLLGAWSGAMAAGKPPLDALDLVEAYATAHPDERAEVTRIFLVTTFGATVVAGGVAEDAHGDTDDLAPRLAALTAGVLFGRRSLRGAFTVGGRPDGAPQRPLSLPPL